MSGECKSYRLNEPMAWKEFKTMPDDVKVTYIKLLRGKYGVPDAQIANMMNINKVSFSSEMKRIGLNVGNGVRSGTTKWDKEGFYSWVNGVDQLPTPVPAEEPIQEPVITCEEPVHVAMGVGYIANPEAFPEGYAEDDLPWNKQEPVPVAEYTPYLKTAVPNNGSMNFTCPANRALNTLAQLLGETNVSISVMWRVVEEGDEANG